MRADYNQPIKTKLPIITERFLTVIMKVLGSKTEMSRQELSNIIRLLDCIDRGFYEEYDTSLGALLKTIEILAKFKLRNKETESEDLADSLLVEIQSELSSKYYTEIVENLIIPTLVDAKNKKFAYDAEFINEEIFTYLQYNKVIVHRDDLVSIANNISTSSGNELREELDKFKTMLNVLTGYYQEIDIDILQNKIIHGSEPSFFNELKTSYDKSKSPTYVLKTGLQLFNQCLSERQGIIPGYYLFYANINSFKSGLLEHFVKWIHIYNTDTFRRIKKKTGKKPVLVYCSLENSKQDDYERFTKIYTNRDIHSFNSFEELELEWKSSIEHMSGIQFEIINDLIDIAYYYPVNPIRVSDINKIFQQLIEQNYIPIACVVDYLEKIKSETEDLKKGENYLLGKISDDLFQLSKTYDCPIISAHQINREGAKTLNTSKDSGKQNAMTTLNSTFIGKDWDIEKPVSFSGFIDLETDPETNIKYLTFKKGKQRGKRTSIETWVHPLKDGIVLEDDIKLSKPISKLAMTPPRCEDLAFHISNKEKTTGLRGRTTLTDAPKAKTSASNAISLKEAAKALLNMSKEPVLDFLYATADSFINYNKRMDKHNLVKSSTGQTYIKGRTYTIQDRFEK